MARGRIEKIGTVIFGGIFAAVGIVIGVCVAGAVVLCGMIAGPKKTSAAVESALEVFKE